MKVGDKLKSRVAIAFDSLLQMWISVNDNYADNDKVPCCPKGTEFRLESMTTNSITGTTMGIVFIMNESLVESFPSAIRNNPRISLDSTTIETIFDITSSRGIDDFGCSIEDLKRKQHEAMRKAWG